MLREIDESAVAPALRLLPAGMDTPRTRVQMLAIGLQESGLKERVQRGGGPAHGLWQFERGGGVTGVLEHPASGVYADRVCRARGVDAYALHAWLALATDDVLAAAFARLLLWTDPHKMPNDAAGGWQLYLRTWRPGKPRPGTWEWHYTQAEDWVMRGIDS